MIRSDMGWWKLLLRAESLYHLLLDVGAVSECVDRCHLPLHDAPCRKGLHECCYLIFRLCFNHEGSGECAGGDASRTDLTVFSQTFEGWNDEFVELLNCLFAV